MADRIACEICGKPVANWEDYEGAEPTEPLCWAEANGGHSPQHAIDALRASRADLARLRALLAEASRALDDGDAEGLRRLLLAALSSLSLPLDTAAGAR